MLVINSDFIIINSYFITLTLFYHYIALMVNLQALYKILLYIWLSESKLIRSVLQFCAITFNQLLQSFVFSYFLQLVPKELT